MFRVEVKEHSFTVYLGERPVIIHTPEDPFVTAGKGSGSFQVRGGHWNIKDSVSEKAALTTFQYDQGRSCLRLSGGELSLTLHLAETDGNLVISPQRSTTGLNRITFSFPAKPGEAVYGAGAQYGGVSLRGRRIPLWVHEKRLGREAVPVLGGSGAHATYLPMPTFFSKDFTFVHVDSPAYGFLDFKHARRHRLELWELPASVTVGYEHTPRTLMRRMTALLGHAPVLPQWCLDGLWMEISGGVEALVSRLEKTVKAGVQVSALCLKDWSGFRETQHGKKPFFDWVWNRELYPRLDQMIKELAARNVRVLAYINPHLSIEGRLFAEASLKGFLVRKPQGGNYINDMGGFMAGHIDLSNPDACAWYKEIIKENILKVGFSGYFADMGEYLPSGAVLYNGEDARRMHNRWPVLWAKLNREAVREAGRTADAVFFTRAGYGGIALQTMLTTTGDHNTGWGHTDGLPSALTAALTLSCSGMGVPLCEAGGNVSQFSRRTEELLVRWAEFAAFMPILRMTELDGQLSFDDSEEMLDLIARLSRVHGALAPYLRACIKEAAGEGMPVLRPLFLELPGQPALHSIFDAYMLGGELLVAPILQKGKTKRKVVLPEGYWVHLWTGKQYAEGETLIDAPLGRPPVFYRPGGKFAELFAGILKD